MRRWRVSSFCSTGCVNKNAWRLNKSCSPNIKAMMLKTVLFLSPICQIRFSNSPGFDRSFLPVEIGDFCRKPLSKTCKKERKWQAKFPFVLLPGNIDSWMCSGILSSWENGIPLNKLFTLGEDFSTRQRKARSIAC